jgi:putative N6-adenine-specific DNA methylase
VTAAELRGLGFSVREPAPGGVAFEADDAGIFLANLHLRTATRVLVRIGEFRASEFHQLERHARGLPWRNFVVPGGAVRLRVTCKKSRLYHSDAVAERIFDAITRAVPGVTATRLSETEDDTGKVAQGQLFVVRFLRDVCTISADSTGALLHRRGYRLATAKAPIRETLAAAMLLAAGYDGSRPLLDPMCGSGTIPIEAALVARRIAPGLHRSFACEAWQGVPTAAFEAARQVAHASVLPHAPAPILGSDRDAGAITRASANADRAGVASDIAFRECALSAIEPPPAAGLFLVNPPYGGRIGDTGALRDLYAQLGNVARAKCPGWDVVLLCAHRALAAQTRLPLEVALRFENGGIPVRALRATAPGGDRDQDGV